MQAAPGRIDSSASAMRPRVAARAIAARSPSRSGSTRLGLGVAEADVVLDEAGAVGREHQPGVEDADVRGAGGGEVVEDRLDERRHQLVAS